jgi:hypothetical protein
MLIHEKSRFSDFQLLERSQSSGEDLAAGFIYVGVYSFAINCGVVLMRKSAIIGALLCAILAVTLVSAAPVQTAPGQNKLLCFDGTSDGLGYGGACTLKSSGAKGTATLDNSGGDPDGEYSGVYVLSSNMYGMPLSGVAQLSFLYTGTATAGSPRYSVPVDTDDDGDTDFWAFVSAYYCNDGGSLVDVINDQTCTIFVSYDPLISYANWAAFVAANPGAEVAALDNYVFIVADDAGLWTVNNVKFGKAGK